MGQALGIQQHTEEIQPLLSWSIPSSTEAQIKNHMSSNKRIEVREDYRERGELLFWTEWSGSLSSRHLRRSLKETRRWVWCWWLHEEELLAEQKYLKSWFKDDSHNLASSGHFLSFGLGASLSWVWQSRLLYFPLVVCILAKPHHPWES